MIVSEIGFNNLLMKGGDKNDMETEINITGMEDKSWFEKIKDWSYENWQTILVILIVLIAGVSAYNHNKQKNNSNPVAVTNNNQLNQNNQNNNNTKNNPEAIAEKEDQKKASQEDNKITSDENKKTINTDTDSNTTKNKKTYTIIAKRGDGITNLARRALKEYIQETNNGSNLNKEQKVYAEDYIQNRTGSEKINVGHKEIFSENLIENAISNANSLSKKSIENLAKYVK